MFPRVRPSRQCRGRPRGDGMVEAPEHLRVWRRSGYAAANAHFGARDAVIDAPRRAAADRLALLPRHDLRIHSTCRSAVERDELPSSCRETLCRRRARRRGSSSRADARDLRVEASVVDPLPGAALRIDGEEVVRAVIDVDDALYSSGCPFAGYLARCPTSDGCARSLSARHVRRLDPDRARE